MYRFTLPLYGVTPKSAITVNWYRNAHHQVSNKAKKKFKLLIQEHLDNFIGTVKKFFQDALVESGLLVDDNVSFITSNSEYYGGIDKDHPRVEAVITKLDFY